MKIMCLKVYPVLVTVVEHESHFCTILFIIQTAEETGTLMVNFLLIDFVFGVHGSHTEMYRIALHMVFLEILQKSCSALQL